MEKVSVLQHKVSNSNYHLGGNREIVIKQETKVKQAKKKKKEDELPLLLSQKLPLGAQKTWKWKIRPISTWRLP